MKRGRGRPLGGKNKPRVKSEWNALAQDTEEEQSKHRGPGRPSFKPFDHPSTVPLKNSQLTVNDDGLVHTPAARVIQRRLDAYSTSSVTNANIATQSPSTLFKEARATISDSINFGVSTPIKAVRFNLLNSLASIEEEASSVGGASSLRKRFEGLDVQSNNSGSRLNSPSKNATPTVERHTGLTPLL